MRTFLSENCARVHPKRPLERGSHEALGMPSNSKRLTVNHGHQHDNPQLKKMKLGSERRAISPLKLPGQLAPTNTKCRSTEQLFFHCKEAVNHTEKRARRKIEMRPPKPIRDDVIIRVGPDGSPLEMQSNCQNKQVEPYKNSRHSKIQGDILFSKQTPGRPDPVSSSRCEVLSSGKYGMDRRPLLEMRSMDNEDMKMGFKVEEAALKGSENTLRNIVGPDISESRNLKVSPFDKIKSVTPASVKRMEGREETGFICTSQGNMERSKLSFQFACGSSYGAKCLVRRTSYDYSRPKSTIQSKSSSIVYSPKDSQPSQIQKDILFSKKAPGRLDPVSSYGCEDLSSGKYDAYRRPLVEMSMTCIDHDGTKMGFKVDEGALELSVNGLRNKVGLGIAESRSFKVTRFDKFKPVKPASEERMEDRKETGIVCTSQSNMERSKYRCQSAGGSSVRAAVKDKAGPALSLTAYDSDGRKNEMSSANKLDCLEIHNSSHAFRDENDMSNRSYNNQENRCESKVLNLNRAPYNDNQVRLYCDEVRKVLDLYKDTVKRLRNEEKIKLNGKGKQGMQIYVDAAMQLKEQHKWPNMQKCVGAVPGVEVGDKFHQRAELVIIGLHSKFVAGIDFKKIDGTLCATSIVASGHYGDKNDSPDVLIYVGEGGNTNNRSQKLEDQKLVRGNLALKNSIDKVPVRVIRSIQNVTAPKSMHANTMDQSKYYYDGLYFVRDCWPEREHCGNLVFKFRLERIQGQKDLARWNTQKTSRKSNKASHGPVVVHDISKGKENMPIRAVNTIDFEKPPPFEYTTKMMYHPQQCFISKPSVCDCLTGCAEDIACSCFVKNNCEVSVNNSVSIVYECGTNCKCPPDCKNRTTQHGVKLQLEVFKTLSDGWGVRSRNFISKGRFICEYVGELLQYKEEGRIDFDKSAIDPKSSKDAENAKYGNVGRFIRHSCSPNLYAKFVLFDHEDKGRPHVMLFAAKNIPPRKELTFDYKLW